MQAAGPASAEQSRGVAGSGREWQVVLRSRVQTPLRDCCESESSADTATIRRCGSEKWLGYAHVMSVAERHNGDPTLVLPTFS